MPSIRAIRVVPILAALAFASPAIGEQTRASAAPAFDISDIALDASCNANPVLERLIRYIVGRPSEAEDDLTYAIGGAIHHQLILSQPVAWRGLGLSGVEVVRGIESGPSDVSLIFRESPDLVVSRLNEQGFHLPAPGATRELHGLMSIGVAETDRGAALTCYKG